MRRSRTLHGEGKHPHFSGTSVEWHYHLYPANSRQEGMSRAMGKDDHLAHTLDLASAMYQYFYARDWKETGDVLVKHPILLTQSAIDLLQDVILELQKRGAQEDAVILQSLMVVLEVGYLRGVRGVLEEINRARNLFP